MILIIKFKLILTFIMHFSILFNIHNNLVVRNVCGGEGGGENPVIQKLF
jgi:hypothetical protein